MGKTKSKSKSHWLKRHFSDIYVKRAQQEGYRCRAVYKLLEIQQKDNIIQPGMTVVDLGAAPGGWSELVVKLLKGRGKVFAVDILPMDPIDGVDFLQGDFRQQDVLDSLLSKIPDDKVDVVLSDMAPNIGGISVVDQMRAMHLAELALDLADKILKKGGVFLVKVFHGEGFDDFLKRLRESYSKVVTRKPDASRKESREVYLLAWM